MAKKSKLPELPLHEYNRNVREEVLAAKDEILKAYKEAAKEDFMVFCRGLTIASQTGPRVFENCMATFQRVCFETMAPSLHAIRDGDCPDQQRFWIERTKKASKDADLAIIMLWLICFPVRPLYMQVGAADRGQAGIVRDRMSNLLHENPWLNEYCEIVGNEVRSRVKMASGKPMAWLEIRSSDVAGSHGGTPDVLIINELSHISKWQFAENLMSNAAGVSQGLVIIATNAGYKGTKAEVWRDNAMVSPDWSVFVLAQPAPWHSNVAVGDEKKRLTLSAYKRLWWGKWQSGKGDALNEDHIKRCFKMTGPVVVPEQGWVYFVGLDLGIKHDHAGLMVLGANVATQSLKTAYWKAWEPTLKSATGDLEVDLIAVERDIITLAAIYHPYVVLYDPAQAVLMAQRLRKANVPTREWPFSPVNWGKMATNFMSVVEEGKLLCYDDQDGRLQRDFGKFNIVEKSYGFRLEAVSDEYGHADVGTALVITIPSAVDFLNGGYGGLGPDDELSIENEVDLTEEEVGEMPSELKALYESEDEFTRPKAPVNSSYSTKRSKYKRESAKDPFSDLD